MARVQVVTGRDADEPLKEAYQEVRRARGRVANVFQVESLNPAAMRAHLGFYMAIMYGRSGLSRQQREMIATAVSAANRCTYCTTHHSEALSKYLKDDEAIRAIKTDYATAQIGPRERAMLDYAIKVTNAPSAVNDADIAVLRRAGLSDADILDTTLVASYFNFVNRLVLSLGVELEAEAQRSYNY